MISLRSRRFPLNVPTTLWAIGSAFQPAAFAEVVEINPLPIADNVSADRFFMTALANFLCHFSVPPCGFRDESGNPTNQGHTTIQKPRATGLAGR